MPTSSRPAVIPHHADKSRRDMSRGRFATHSGGGELVDLASLTMAIGLIISISWVSTGHRSGQR